jgi:hypothetical protein
LPPSRPLREIFILMGERLRVMGDLYG